MPPTEPGNSPQAKPAGTASSAHLRNKQRQGPTFTFTKPNKSAINALASDNRRLKEELLQEDRFNADPSSQAAKKLIHNLEEQDEVYETLIIEQQKEMERLLNRESELQNVIAAQRAAMGGINRATEVSVRAQRRVILLENRVQQAATARSTAELQAAKLKEKVDGLRREKKLFEELTAKMEAAVAEKAQEVADVLKKITEVHDAKGKAQAMKAQVVAQIAKDAAASEAEWYQLTGIINADRGKREAAAAQKAAERARRMEELMQKQRGVRLNRGRRKPATAASAGDGKNRAGVARTSTIPGIEDGDVSSKALPLERLHAVQAKLAAVVAGVQGCESAEDAVHALTELKEICYKLFASLTEAHKRLEELEDKVQPLRAATNAAAAAAEAAAAAAAAAEMSDRAALGSVEELEKQIEEAETQVKNACIELHILCQRLRSTSLEIEAALIKEGPPSPSTLLLYIGLLEHWAIAALSQTLPAQGTSSPSNEAGLSSPGWQAFNQTFADIAPGLTALVDPPSVGGPSGHRGSVSSRSSSSAHGGKYKNPKAKRPVRMSQASSESSDTAKVMTLDVLGRRAKKAVEIRIADAAITTITAHNKLN